jgi:hypothetical protein
MRFYCTLFSVETIYRLMIELLMNWKGSRRKQSLPIRGTIPDNVEREEKQRRLFDDGQKGRNMFYCIIECTYTHELR